jgi:hypothetical protein
MSARFLKAAGIVLVIVATVGAAIFIQLRRASLSVSDVVSGPVPFDLASAVESGHAVARGTRIDFLTPTPLGVPLKPEDRPLVANVQIVDLDADRMVDVLVADAALNQVTWMRQSPAGQFTERSLAEVPGPAHMSVADVDRDGDRDVIVASLGVLFPNNARIGAVIVLENDGSGAFTRRVIVDHVARVADVRAGDLDGDGDLDLAVAGFGYDQGETMWLENLGNWAFTPHLLQELSGVINAEIADADGDGDQDIVSLVSQQYEEIYVFANDGRGRFTPTRIFGASNEDFGSSWISIADLDGDRDLDVLYSNGDAFDYAPPKGRNWNGVQWLENTGGLRFTFHRIADMPGASSPQAGDMDGDGDLDLVVVSAYNDWARPDAQSLAWFENTGQAAYTMRPLAGSPTHLITLGVADVTGDGRPDLVTGGMHMSGPYDRMSRVTLWTNRGSPTRAGTTP